MNWQGFKYEPVRGLLERLQRRINRSRRRSMLRHLVQRGFDALILRTTALRDNTKLHGDTKFIQFRRILDDYAALVTDRTSPPTSGEAPHNMAQGLVGVPSA